MDDQACWDDADLLLALACYEEELRGAALATDTVKPPAVPRDPEALSQRTAELVADLVEPAKATALEKLGEGRQALGVTIADRFAARRQTIFRPLMPAAGCGYCGFSSSRMSARISLTARLRNQLRLAGIAYQGA